MNLGEARDDLSSASSTSDINKRSLNSADNDKIKSEVEEHLSNHSIQMEDQLNYPLSSSGGMIMIQESAIGEEEGSPFRINSSDAAAKP